jgi:hypothetical protein
MTRCHELLTRHVIAFVLQTCCRGIVGSHLLRPVFAGPVQRPGGSSPPSLRQISTRSSPLALAPSTISRPTASERLTLKEESDRLGNSGSSDQKSAR